MVDVSENWYQTIIRTVDEGRIEELFELVGTPIITEVVKSGVSAIESTQLDLSDRRKIKVTTNNLYDKQEIQLLPRPSGSYDFEVEQQNYYRASSMIPNKIGNIVHSRSNRSELSRRIHQLTATSTMNFQ